MSATSEIDKLYDIINYRNAVGILESGNPAEFHELLATFTNFRFSKQDIIAGGGNESNIPKKFSVFLKPLGWRETRISGDLLVKLKAKKT